MWFQLRQAKLPAYTLLIRIATRREKMDKVVDTLCPTPILFLEKNKSKSLAECIPKGTGTPVIEVESIGGDTYVVDLTRTCACRRWDLTGIPCKHDIVAVNFMRQKPEDYVDACYLKSTYMVIYSHTVKPVNGMDLWIPTDSTPILLPQYNRKYGRPKKKRNKDAYEKETNGKL
ncbi:PREDICTED: uncharacterized protein LOC101310232 [Fragaria vesca subsp. vesca]|uniref:uncharacterized protein LOC101310232 n=1 Tax=Fragaria vesca subsp. vesca TaxID=101020 RepID=UPI0002C2E041|nr:PREDICTED: uncharacterized protein LOC101310232 [Fragaria vesca subsp. vesca]